MIKKLTWFSNTRYWAQAGDLTVKVEFGGGVWSWVILENEDQQDERIVAGGNSPSAAAAKKAAAKAMRSF